MHKLEDILENCKDLTEIKDRLWKKILSKTEFSKQVINTRLPYEKNISEKKEKYFTDIVNTQIKTDNDDNSADTK